MTPDLLPPNSTKQERAIALTTARISSVPVPVKTLWNPATCPIDILPWLAWSLSIDAWDPNWTEAEKRASVAASIDVHIRKGTVGALRRALSALGYEIEIDENRGTIFTFRLQVDVSTKGVTDTAFFDRVEAVAETVKNARSHLLGVDALLKTSATISPGASSMNIETTKVNAFVTTLLDSAGGYFFGCLEQTIETTKVAPSTA